MADEHQHGSDPSVSPSARANAERTRAFVFDRFEREARAVSQLHHGGLGMSCTASGYTNSCIDNSGLEILRGVARQWASSSPDDETLRGTATTGAWRSVSSGAWIAASGSWPAAISGAWPVGSWPGAASGSWPAAAASGPSSTTPSATFSAPSMNASRLRSVAWKLVLMMMMAAAVLAGLVVFAIVRALEGR